MAGFCLFEAASYVAWKYGVTFSPSLSAPFWFPDTVMLTALLLSRPRHWWIFLCAVIPIRFLVTVFPERPDWFLLAAFANDSLKALASAFLLRRFLPDISSLGRLRGFGIYALIAVILVPALSATAGAFCGHLLGFDYAAAWVQWFLGNSLTNLVLTSSVLHWISYFRNPPGALPGPRIIEAGLLAAGLAVTSFLAFGGHAGDAGNSTAAVYLPVPFLLWAATRFGARATASALALLAGISIWSAASSHGPFATRSIAENVLHIQLFLFVAGVPMLFLAGGSEDRKRAEHALRLSEERYREVVESQNEMVCRYQEDTTLTFVNEAYCRFFGKSRDELLGRKFLELIPPAAHEHMRDTIARLAREKQSEMHEHEVLRPDGSIGWHQWENFAVMNEQGLIQEFQAVGRDITERQAAQEALRESETKMSLAADAAGLGFWMWDVTKDEIWLTANRREVLGVDESEPLNYATFMQRVHPEDRLLVAEKAQQAIGRDEVFECEYRITTAGGERRWIASRGRSVRNAGGAVSQLMGVSLDITVRKRTEEAMQNLAHADRLSLIGELTGSIAHEINQPLGSILINAQAAERLLETEFPPLEELRDILSDIRHDDLRASEVIRNIRALLGKRALQMQPLHLEEVVEDALRMILPDARRRGVFIERPPSPPLPVIRGDRVHLQQVLLNLLLNGMDAMAGIEQPGRRLTVRTVMRERCVELAVTDCGHGIPEDKLAIIFDSFFTTKENGMGLGLAMARSVAEAHAGRITAENNADAGATFRLFLPMAAEKPGLP